MPTTRAYRRYKRGARKTARTGGIRHSFRGAKFAPSMTVGKVKRIIDAELKLKDSNVSALAVPNTLGFSNHLSIIDQGDLNTERSGNWIKPVSLHGTVVIQGNTTNVIEISRFKVYVVQWREDQGLNPITLAKVVQSVINPHQAFNVESKGQFKILWSWTDTIVNNTENSQFVKTRRFYVKPPRKVLYDVDEFKKEQLFIWAFSDTAILDDPPFISFGIRLRYTDS